MAQLNNVSVEFRSESASEESEAMLGLDDLEVGVPEDLEDDIAAWRMMLHFTESGRPKAHMLLHANNAARTKAKVSDM